MGFAAISNEDHLAQMRRTQEFRITQALERDALLVRNREERVVGWWRARSAAAGIFLQHGASLDSGDAE
jgi:hypothetical protein